MPQSPHRITSLTEYRADCAALTGWVQHMGGRLWLTKHGKFVAAVVPVFQCERLEEWERLSLADTRRRMEEDYRRWKRVKAVSGKGRGDVVWE